MTNICLVIEPRASFVAATDRQADAPSNLSDLGSLKLITVSGVENVNGDVSAATSAIGVAHILAQVVIAESNSMIERWFMSLRPQWLYLHDLSDLPYTARLIDFFVEQHNAVIPHSAFRGQTPDGLYFGIGDHVSETIEAGRALAREARIEADRAAWCGACSQRGFVNHVMHADRSNTT